MADTQSEEVQAEAPVVEDKTSAVETKPEGEAETKTETKDDESKAEVASDDAGDEAKDTKDEEPKKKLSGLERLKRRLAAAEAENAGLRSRVTDGEVSASDLERVIGKAPNEADFKGDYLAYERALTAYELDKRQTTREIKREAENAIKARTERVRDLVEEHNERIEDFRETVKDFDSVMQASAHLAVSPTVEELLLESDKSAHLQYYLAKNPSTLQRLNEMSEREAAREIGRIESSLSLPKSRTRTSAPKPVSVPKGAATPAKDPAKMTMSEYVKWRGADNTR